MLFQTYGDRRNPAVLFFHAMGVTGASSEPIARYLQDRYFCILPTSTVYCEEQKYVSKLDEIRQWRTFCIDRAWSGWRWWSLLPSVQTLPWRF